MAWYHDEANNQNEIDNDKAQKRLVIQHSNFWAALRQQIDSDVAGINETELWKKRLDGFRLTIQSPLDGDGYSIRMAGDAALTVTLRHKGDHVEVGREFIEDPLNGKYPSTEILNVCSDGTRVYLKTSDGKDRFILPEQAAKYILMPFIELLKTVKPEP